MICFPLLQFIDGLNLKKKIGNSYGEDYNVVEMYLKFYEMQVEASETICDFNTHY
jgi:hypothetical protein